MIAESETGDSFGHSLGDRYTGVGGDRSSLEAD